MPNHYLLNAEPPPISCIVKKILAWLVFPIYVVQDGLKYGLVETLDPLFDILDHSFFVVFFSHELFSIELAHLLIREKRAEVLCS